MDELFKLEIKYTQYILYIYIYIYMYLRLESRYFRYVVKHK